MAGTLRIREDVVQSCLKDGQRSISMLSTSQNFTDSMAQAAGCNGPLRETLRGAEENWRIRRQKMLEILENLVANIRDVNQGFVEADASLGRELTKGGDAPGSAGDGAAPGAGTSPGAGGGGGEGSGAPVDSRPAPEPLQPLAPLDPGGEGGGVAPGGAGHTSPRVEDFDRRPGDPGQPAVSDIRALLEAFVVRWAEMTGRPVGEVMALLTTAAGLAGLLALLSSMTGTTDGSGGNGGPGTGSGNGADAPDDGTTGEGSGGAGDPADGDTDGVGERPEDVGEGGDAAVDQEPVADGPDDDPAGVEPEDPTAELPRLEENPAGIPEENDAAHTPPGDETPPGGAGVAEDVAADLMPEPGTIGGGAASVDLPDLAQLPGEELGGGGSSSAPVELPPLASLEDGDPGSVGATSGTESSLDLPDLTEPTREPVEVAGQPSAELPDLTTESSGQRRMGMPMMGGVGMGAGGAAQSATTQAGQSGSTSAERQSVRRDVKDVLGDVEKGREQ